MGQQTLILTSHTHQRRKEFEINKSVEFILSSYQNMVLRVTYHTVRIFSYSKSLESVLFIFICIHASFGFN